ncbi:MAG: glycosyltransferase family 2 protein, partial [Bryobacteraceae bacterium]
MSRTGEPPLVSVVSPSYNMSRYLPQTIESVLSQDYPRIEYIVMDGGSTDGTLDILERYKDRLQHRSERDRGPADAIHRGFELARGEIFAWLNADDLYLPGAISAAVAFFEAHPGVDVVYGEGAWIDAEGNPLGNYPTLPFEARQLERGCFICQPAAFFRASAYRRCGLDPARALTFDYDLWIRMAKRNFRFAHLRTRMARTRMHRSTLTLRQRKDVFRESIDLLKKHYGYVPFTQVLSYTAFCIDRRDQFF